MVVWLSLSEKRVRRLWSQLKLQLPRRRGRKRRLGTDVRLPGEPRPNSVWTYDFVHDRLADKTNLKLLCVLDEHTRECLAIEVARSMSSMTVIQTLARLMRLHGKPTFIRSDQGKETATVRAACILRAQRVGPHLVLL
jgi:putative transposase